MSLYLLLLLIRSCGFEELSLSSTVFAGSRFGFALIVLGRLCKKCNGVVFLLVSSFFLHWVDVLFVFETKNRETRRLSHTHTHTTQKETMSTSDSHAATGAAVTADAAAAALASDVKAVLDVFDKDGDGKLNAEEIAALKTLYREQNAKVAAGKAAPEVAAALKALRSRYDRDGDGRLEDTELAQLHEDIKSTDTMARYIPYAARLTALWRYAAYTSDLGEAFRPVAHPYVVTGTYAVSWLYVVGDTAWEGYKDYNNGTRGQELYQHITKRATFQAIASMALPAFTIHSTVHFFKDALKKQQNARLRSVGPTVAGLCVIPFLPLYDHPVEYVTEQLFDKFWPVGGSSHGHHDKKHV